MSAILDFTRRIMDATVQSQPLRSFVQREPQLALRLLMGPRGAIHNAIARALGKVVADTDSPERASELEHNIHVVVRVGTALQWGTLRSARSPRPRSRRDPRVRVKGLERK